jgi:hypothetical protein
MAARASPEIRPNEADERGFVISFPIFSSIETEQHERRDNEAQRRCHEQPRYIETDQEKDGHEEHAQPAPEDFAPVKKKISGASCPQPDRTLQLIRVERIRRKRTFFQQRVRRKTRILVPTARENLIQKPRHTGFQKGFSENNSVVLRVHAKTVQFLPHNHLFRRKFWVQTGRSTKTLDDVGRFRGLYTMAASKLDSILNNIRTILSDVDIRSEPEWDLPTLEHAKARLQSLAGDALEAMNLIDELIEQHAED